MAVCSSALLVESKPGRRAMAERNVVDIKLIQLWVPVVCTVPLYHY